MKYRVRIAIKPGVLDPEMETLQRLLKRSGVSDIQQVVHTQQYDICLNESVPAEEAERVVRALAEDVLANPEIHEWTIEAL